MDPIDVRTSTNLPKGAVLERLYTHPSLPLVAGLDRAHPAVHVWQWEAGALVHVTTVEAGEPYGDAVGWDRMQRTPAVAWHPHEARLLVMTDLVREWTPDGVTTPSWARSKDGASGEHMPDIAFSPDGGTIWIGGYGRSAAIDPATGTRRPALHWDTTVTTWPGGLALSYISDQGATHGLFSRIDTSDAPAELRPLDRALLIDVDGYEAPALSADGRYLAIRGNAYEHALFVFEMPDLRLAIRTSLGDYGDEPPWSSHNIAFTGPRTLWVSTPNGTLVALDVVEASAEAYELPRSSPGTALASTADGGLAVATADGGLALVNVPGAVAGHAAEYGAAVVDRRTAAAVAKAYLDAADEIPLDEGSMSDPESIDTVLDRLTTTDGVSTWTPDDLEVVTETDEGAPTWLQIRAFMNKTTHS